MAVLRNDASLARLRLQFVIVTAVGLGAGAIGLVRLAGDGAVGGYTLLASASLVVIGVAGVLFLLRVSKVSIRTDAEGLTVRNVLSTRRFAWSEIERVDEIESRRSVTQAIVRTSAGKVYPLTACGDPGPACHTILATLKRELAARRA